MVELTIDEEVEQRLDRIESDPERLRRYDRDGDGTIDTGEWDVVRQLVEAEVRTERRRERGAASSDPESQESLHETSVLRDRYEQRRVLGRGGQGITYLAWDLETGEPVPVKKCAIREADGWMGVEMFDREAETLEALDHPPVPDYVDAWRHKSGGRAEFYLVQEFVEGGSLEELIEGGYRFSESEARETLAELLEILRDLHCHDPPVVHRDVKPSNVIRRPGGGLALIDFGAVRRLEAGASRDAEIVGTSGYMPLEQAMGEAEPATDVYAAAASALYLVTATHPSDLPSDGMQPDFRSSASISEDFGRVLDDMLAPHAEDRSSDVDALVDRLRSRADSTTLESSNRVAGWLEESRANRPNFAVSEVSAEDGNPAITYEFERTPPSLYPVLLAGWILVNVSAYLAAGSFGGAAPVIIVATVGLWGLMFAPGIIPGVWKIVPRTITRG